MLEIVALLIVYCVFAFSNPDAAYDVTSNERAPNCYLLPDALECSPEENDESTNATQNIYNLFYWGFAI